MSDIQLDSIQFGSKRIEFSIEYKSRKTLGIRVYPDCSVRVIAPVETCSEKLYSKIKSKASWILKQQQEFLAYHPTTPARKYLSGETHLYLGKQYRLKTGVEEAVGTVKLKAGRLMVSPTDPAQVKRILTDWYKRQSVYHFSAILQSVVPLFSKYHIQQPDVQILKMPTRWGSCTPNGKIILNPELVKASKSCIEYVIAHELCHLIYHNHTNAFYQLQESIMPDWKQRKEKLEATLT